VRTKIASASLRKDEMKLNTVACREVLCRLFILYGYSEKDTGQKSMPV